MNAGRSLIQGAHPRSRGENTVLTGRAPREMGSSPLTRGKRDLEVLGSPLAGLIPAHAGKTTPDRPSPSASWAHPRSRGENGTRSDLAYVTEGSSPLTRGKLVNVLVGQTRSGLIPAHAGKTWRPARGPDPSRAHPRSRGENDTPADVVTPIEGSSPLTRGKRVSRSSLTRRRGLIPAHAGKTEQKRALARAQGAHPRSRGENVPPGRRFEAAQGSSPLTRGKRPSWSSS